MYLKSWLFLVSLCSLLPILTPMGAAQNLIRNHSFEEVDCPENPINSFDRSPTWYAVGADAYWMHVNCPVDLAATASVLAIKPQLTPNLGLGYISLEGVLTANGFLITEGVGIELTKALSSNHAYFFEVAAIYYDAEKGPELPEDGCDDILRPRLEVRVANDPIGISLERTFVGPNLLVSAINQNSELVLDDQGAERPGFVRNRWFTYYDCFFPKGGETHLAVMGRSEKLEGPEQCILEGEPGFLFNFGYALDEVFLVEIPKAIDSSMVLCPEVTGVDLRQVVVDPLGKRAFFVWDDGFEGAQRPIERSGIYRIDMILPCVTVPITLDIERSDCAPEIFFPNVFSPNGDGLNDEFFPSIGTSLTFSSYDLKVFNRWGQVVYQSTAFDRGWDGQIRGTASDTGVYVWVLSYSLAENPESTRVLSGEVLLVK